ncbi:putative necrosis-inducing factor-domain-containing protein [Dactylonectria macrodidyma]|uniref:Necrosis-inducing factor-domain-containing protein n=1 Tax=Dactylonectria macrodidyma TaxID=307937 RepID=A0A9P9DZ26_9HYPO|nr:putative necrosis-inducing factor-domain-containing protein [Dactylonectria macrodidyma]
MITTFLAMSQAAALPKTPQDAKSALEARASINDCGDSTFINQSSGGSPTVNDCRQIAYNIRNGGTWTVGAGGEHHQLVQYGTCAFGAQGDGSINAAYIGNQDIIDLINSSIDKFQWNGLVGAKGSMGCQSLKGLVGGATMNWGIYHT